MAERDSWATMNGATKVLNTEDFRVATTALWTPGTTALRGRQGIRPGPGTPGKVTVSGTPDANVHIAAFQALVRASRGLGEYIATLDADKTLNLLTADPMGVLPRIDLIVAVQTDTYYLDGSTAFEVRQVVGAPHATPVDPDVTAETGAVDYLLLERVNLPAGATTVQDSYLDHLSSTLAHSVALGGVLPVHNVAERDELTGWPGATIYRLDKGWYETHDGTAWRIRGQVTVSSLADVTHPYTDQVVLLSTDRMYYRWASSTWFGFLPVGGTAATTRHRAKYTQTGAGQSIPNLTQQRLLFNNPVFTTSDWTTVAVAGGTKFTCVRTGAYSIKLNARLGSGVAGERALTLAKDGLTVTYGLTSGGTGGTFPWSGSVSIEEDFVAGDEVAAYLYHGSAGAVSLDLAGGPTSITFRYIGHKTT